MYLLIKKCIIMVPLGKDYYLNIAKIKSYWFLSKKLIDLKNQNFDLLIFLYNNYLYRIYYNI